MLTGGRGDNRIDAGAFSGPVVLDGGPSFNALRVPYSFSVSSVAQPTGGHEKVKTKISAKQLHAVAAWIAQVTRQNPILAKPTDG